MDDALVRLMQSRVGILVLLPVVKVSRPLRDDEDVPGSIDGNDGTTAGRIGISSGGAGSELVLAVHDTVSECHKPTGQL
jgi:hypothetical protein